MPARTAERQRKSSFTRGIVCSRPDDEAERNIRHHLDQCRTSSRTQYSTLGGGLNRRAWYPPKRHSAPSHFFFLISHVNFVTRPRRILFPAKMSSSLPRPYAAPQQHCLLTLLSKPVGRQARTLTIAQKTTDLTPPPRKQASRGRAPGQAKNAYMVRKQNGDL